MYFCISLSLQILATEAAKKNVNRKFVADFTDLKEFKKELRTHNNVMVLFSKDGEFFKSIIFIFTFVVYI